MNDVDALRFVLQLPGLTPRGVQLGTIFMQGVEHAIFANDACGAPVPWGMTCVWHFFDGKLFHYKLLKASSNATLIDLCDGQVRFARVRFSTFVCIDDVSVGIWNERSFNRLRWLGS